MSLAQLPISLWEGLGKELTVKKRIEKKDIQVHKDLLVLSGEWGNDP